MMSAPARAKSSKKRSGSTIIRCRSSGIVVALADRLDDGGPDGDVRDELPVHHVDVKHVGAGDLDRLHLFAQS